MRRFADPNSTEDALRITGIQAWWQSRTRWEKTAPFVWSLVLLFVCVRAFLRPTDLPFYPIFSGSPQLWWNSEDFSEPERPKTVQDLHRYRPTLPILFTPLAF